ncbi:MAG: hypothetical protein M5R40_20525 [Anaerolineae bacterium]|nr:hypothetical protein [Anaerolineae bacterium]
MWTWRVVVAVQDAHGRRASFKVFLPTEHYSYEQAAAWVSDFLPRLDAVIGGVVVDARIERELTFPDLGRRAGAGRARRGAHAERLRAAPLRHRQRQDAVRRKAAPLPAGGAHLG